MTTSKPIKQRKVSPKGQVNPDPISLIPAALDKTGFPLEHDVSIAFSQGGWTVINNRYYVDDVDGKARELDLIAYKISHNKEITVVTSLLISCKKDQEHWWSFLSRSRPKQDPNTDWSPIHVWTNNELLESFLSNTKWKKEYFETKEATLKKILDIERQAFAFQLISLDGRSPRNDKPIFESVSGLMKALDYELSALKSRAKDNRLYNFNLINVVDADLVDVKYDDHPAVPHRISEFKHIARYVVRKRELTARVHFVQRSEIKNLIQTYNQLAIYDVNFFNRQVNSSFTAIKHNRNVQAFFAKRLTTELRWRMNAVLRQGKEGTFDENLRIDFDKSSNELKICVPIGLDGVALLSANKDLNETIKQTLENICRYKGLYQIDCDIPF